MKRLLLALALCLAPLGAEGYWQSRLQVSIDSTPSTTTYDPANKDANIALSNGNLTGTVGSVAFYPDVRSISSRGTGKCYFTVTIDAAGGWGVYIGFVNAAFDINSATPLGQDVGANSLGWTFNSSAIVIASIGIGNAVTYGTAGDVPNMAINFDTKKIWARLGSGDWNNDVIGNQNPATGTGGFDFSAINAGPYYIAASAGSFGGTIWTINFGAAPYSPAAPSGFGNC